MIGEGRHQVLVGGVWLRNIAPVRRSHGARVQVLVEYEGRWRLAIEEEADGNYSHIVEPFGIRSAPIDESLA